MASKTRKDNHVATSQAEYTFEEVQLLKRIDEHKRQIGKSFLTAIELYRWLDGQGLIRHITPAEMPIIRRPRPLRRLENENY